MTCEAYMQSCMRDSAHDAEHVYRVLNYALDIAAHESNINLEILSAACLLHDVGQIEQLTDPAIDHAVHGAEMAYAWLTENGYSNEFAGKVKECIRTHRYRSSDPPRSNEAKILFDADKVDACGAIGMARVLFCTAQLGEPLYTLDENDWVSDGTDDESPSFFREYKFKLENMYDRFYTRRGAELAGNRKAAARNFYEALLREARECYLNAEC